MFGSTPFGSNTFGSNTSAFGASSTGTGFGSTGFGAGTSLFGAKTTASTFGGFGSTAQTGTSLFGNTAKTGIFGSTPNAFGTTTNTQNTSGFGGFGTNTASTGLFGATTTAGSSLFSGTQNTFSAAKPFGATASTTGSVFGTPASSGTSLFGTGSMFNSSNTSGGLFGSTSTAQSNVGTPAKFVPQQSTDTMTKNGIQTNINTKHQCVTLMKEYESKSLEELRAEDYQLGRKGPQASATTATGGSSLFSGGSSFGTTTSGLTSGFGTGGFGTSTGTSLFGQQAGTSSLFGAKTTAPGLFGATSTFSTPSVFSTNTGLFGAKPGGLFNTATTTASGTGLFGSTGFGTSTSGTGLFGTSTFGQPAQQSLFGTSQPSTGLFGTTPAFGAPTTSTGTSLFATPAFGQTSQSLFGAKTTAPTLGTAFGSANTGSIFGTQNKPFGLGTTSTFGAPASTGLFGNTGGTSLFGNTTLGTGGLQTGTFGSTLGTTFGTTGLGNTTGFGTLGQANVAALQQQQQLQQQLQQHVFALTSSPFGDSPLFRNLTSRSKEDKSTVVTTQARQRGSTTPSHYRVSPRPSARVKPRAIGKNGFSQARLFDGLDDENDHNNEMFVPRRSIKKLVIKNNAQNSRSISSELANSIAVNNGEEFEVNGLSDHHGRKDSTDSLKITRDKMFSTPKANNVQTNSQESPVIGVRRPDSAERRLFDHEEHDVESPLVGVRQSKKTIGYDSVEDIGERRSSHRDDFEQGPEPQDGNEAAEIDNNQDDNVCRVTLTKPNYYCNPSINELNEMVNDDGEVIVGDFVVGRQGYGMVKFFGESNITGLNLDEIVWFRRREIEVYPDTYPSKPPVGKGLNKKAEITLYKVWPSDKAKRTPIKSPERLKMVGWLDKLEAATARLGATFVDYQAETGTWIFTVDHFTRYGLKEIQIEVKGENGSSETQRTLASIIEEKEKQQEKEKFEREQEMIRKQRLQDEITLKKKMLQDKLYEEESYVMRNEGDSQMTDISQDTFSGFQEPLDENEDITSPASHHLATTLGLKSHRMQVMKASFFGETDDMRDAYMPSNDVSRDDDPLNNKSVLSATTMNDYHRKQAIAKQRQYEGPVVAAVKGFPASPLLKTSQRSSKERRTDNDSFRQSSRWYNLPQPILLPSIVGDPSETSLKAAGVRTQPVVVPLQHSVTSGKQNLYGDSGLTMGRSFRVGWGPGWTLVARTTELNSTGLFDKRVEGSPLVLRKTTSKQQALGSFSLKIMKVSANPNVPDDIGQEQLSQRLCISLENSEKNEDEGSFYFTPVSGVNALHEYSKVATKNKEVLASGPIGQSAATFSTVMDLAVALWGSLSRQKDSMEIDEENTDRNNYNDEISRKEALSRWLSESSTGIINQEVEASKIQDNNHLRVIFSLLTGKQISAACQVAHENGDSRLALLLAQACSTKTVRHWLLKQLEDWLEHKVDKFITRDRLKIYALLAGETMWRDIRVCEDLDWKRAFSLHFWFKRSASGLIIDALQSYEDAFQNESDDGYAAEPCPPYVEELDDDDRATIHCRDTCYHLIKLFCTGSHKLETTLAPASYTRYQLDVSLSWHLYQVLQAVGYTHLSEQYSCYLCTNYAAQLETVGLWQWAIYVLLHIRDPIRREQAVRTVLIRYCSLDNVDADKEMFLLEDLNLPEKWIHEAKVVRARYDHHAKEEAVHLLKSGYYNLCHQVILTRLASLAIINEEYDSIKDLLVEIAPKENSSLVKNWNTGGQIYLDYIKLCEKFNDIKNGLLVPTTYHLEKMQAKVSSLCHRIGQLPNKTATDRLCQSDMGTECANFLKIIAQELILQSEKLPAYTTHTSVLVPHIQKLPLPEDCCLTELRDLTNHYIDELAQL